MSLFPSLSTRHFASPLLLHQQSCCPTMDVALLSNPTNAGSEASMHLYRLSGSSDDDVSSIVDASRLQLDDGVAAGGGLVSSSKVWEETVSSARVPGTDGNPSSGSSNHPTSSLGHHKGKGRQRRTSHGSSAADSILKPRLPETAAWSPDGKASVLAWTMLRARRSTDRYSNAEWSSSLRRTGRLG